MCVRLTCLIIVMLCATQVASALTFTDIITGPVLLDGDKGLKTFTILHDFSDDGFLPGQDTFSAGLVTMTFDDDTCLECRDTSEFLQVVIGGTTYCLGEIEHMQVFTFALDGIAMADLNADGLLPVQIDMANRGDLYFVSSELTAHAPEPSTLLLLGSGLAGVVGIGLRQQRKQRRS
jgi:hypothetical protein